MRLKKNWAKVLSSALAVTIAFSSLGSVPITAYAQEEGDVTSEDSGGKPIALADSNVFTNIGDKGMTIDENSVTLEAGGDHFAMYNDCEKVQAFTWEADVKLNDGPSAALVIANDKDNPSASWYGANINTTDNNNVGQFRIFSVNFADDKKLEEKCEACWTEFKKNDLVHLKLDVNIDGTYTYTFGNTGADGKSIEGKLPNWQGGYVGILTWNTTATFSNIVFKNKYNTNLEGLIFDANLQVTDDGLHSNAVNKGDSFLYSTTRGSNFVYSTDVTFKKDEGAAALIFRRTGNSNDPKNCYVVNLNAESKKCRFWRWENDRVHDLITEKTVESNSNKTYNLKVVAIDSWISYYVDNKLVASTGDYTGPWNENTVGQNTAIKEGCFGLLNWNGDMVFQNTYYQDIKDKTDLLIDGISISSSENNGTIEKPSQFVPTEPITIQYVSNEVEKVDVKVNKKNSDTVTTIEDAEGNGYEGGKNIPIAVGANYITIKNSLTINGIEAMLTYRVNVHRRQKNEVYYNELYRDQYHYSVKDGWANDPNGLVYYNGTYHMFYQFYDDTKWGPMHWAHATSEDLIHWEEKPIALYPDANGTMYSGCIVVDAENESGLFKNSNGGLVALITAHGNGQRIKLAYSEDEGNTWTKVDEIVADWTADPLEDGAFRDPKVFRWEGKWFMVVAGGPLRIYSSDNLKEWKCESTYKDLHTECPDLYPITADDGTLKWVLSRGGRFYKVGNFKQVDGNWKFVPDSDYDSNDTSKDGVMNFGKDSYAAMTYYVQDFGTASQPTLPEIIELNWMNTWEDYCNLVADKVGQKFNGTFNLNLKLGLKKDENGKYVLTQTPINKNDKHSGYEELRNEEAAITLENTEVSENNDLLNDFKGDCYEIVSKFTPAAGTKKVGFKVRTSDTESTDIVYDLEEESLSIDRSKSGVIISNEFAKVNSQKVTKNVDGSIDLHIYVDRASVEVFANEYTVAGANQIFPSVSSLGLSVFVEGEPATADITIYQIDNIWTNKVTVTEPIEIGSSSPSESNINVDSKLDLSAYLLPADIEQDIEWSVDDDAIVSIKIDETDKTKCNVTGLKAGTAKITAKAAKKTSLTKTFTVNVFENNFDTNIEEFTANGNWFINGEILSVSNTAANDSYMGTTKIPYKEYTLETELKYERGLINIFFASESTNPDGAYAIQLKDNDEIRLFRFAMDGDIKIGKISEKINDNQFHTVKIDKTQNSVTVSIDGTECLEHTFDKVEAFYNNAYVGLGLWDGALEAKSFNVTEKGQTEPSSQPSTAPSTAPSTQPSTAPSTAPSTQPSTAPSTAPSTQPTAIPKYAVIFDTSAVKNATVSVQKDGRPFESGDSISEEDKLQLVITPDTNYVFSEIPVVTANNISVGTAIGEDGKYTFTIHSARATAKVTVSCTTAEKQFTVTLPDEVKNSVKNATAELDFNSVIANGTAKIIITPKEGHSIVSAKASVNSNTCQLSNAEKTANGVYVIVLSKFTSDTIIDSLVVETEEVEVKEGETAIETNIGEANLSETEFKDIKEKIKDDIKTAFDDVIKEGVTEDTTAKDIENAKDAVEALNAGTAFIEIALTVDKKFSGMTENEIKENETKIKDIEDEIQKINSGATVEVKSAITLDISLFSICKNREDNKEIARTSLKELAKPVRISMKLSDEIKIPKKENGVTREYYIICLHKNKDGKIESEKIPCGYNDKTNTISFPANRFSTYVLCYVDITPKSSNSSIVLNGGISAGSGAGAGSGTVTATPVPTATATPVPTTTASAKPGVTGGTTPTATPVPSDKPSATGTPSVTGSPVATNPPADSTATPSSEVKKGTKVTVKDISYKVTSIGNTKTVKYISAKKDVKKAVVPASIEINGKKYKVTVIANNAFKGNKKLTKVTIGKNVKSIGKNAFKGCKNLKKIVVKTKKLTAKKVGSNAFKGINSNATVKVPKNKVKAYKQILKAKGAGKNIKVTK